MSPSSLQDRFSQYFSRAVAERAAQSISDGSEIEIQVTGPAGGGESLTFVRRGKRNAVEAGPARAPHFVFTLSPAAAESILADTSEDIGEIGVNILKLVFSQDPALKVGVKIKAGFFTLMTGGYLGVMAAGGGGFASYLASKGFNGMGAIKAALKKAGR